VVGFAAGIPEIPLNLPLLKGCQVVGVFWGAFTEREPERFRAAQAELLQLWSEGRIRPRISGRLPLTRAAEALTLVEQRRAIGKIVLTADPDGPPPAAS
jgi:NADPH2:quinone reductase